MTELDDAESTEQEIVSLSGHVTSAAARIYMERTERQRLHTDINAVTRSRREQKGVRVGMAPFSKVGMAKDEVSENIGSARKS